MMRLDFRYSTSQLINHVFKKACSGNISINEKGRVLVGQFLPIIFQLHLHTPDQTKISKQLLVFIKKLKILT